ncbi:hypothetical protein GQ43DRAFT_452893 [Delitschia confertaspora ATCC 74209]|uniref:SsDNA binding protein n=1 Tax=Delitschia confertaspora ATCC 74209 TaxID=1513339 RepID=A0A9P4MWJ8_9PLEO|nr:hypothetical protein GQ43DRAFT_452893 [Delitschia confertaspora ATCC 74209]
MSFLNSTLRTFSRSTSSSSLATRAFSTTPRASLARMSIVGRLGAVPEEVQTSTDKNLVRFVVGSKSGKGENQKTSWFRIASFVEGGQKEFLMGLPKGTLLYVDADARLQSYQDKEGQQRSSLSLVARNFDVISRPREQEIPGEGDEGLVSDEGRM